MTGDWIDHQGGSVRADCGADVTWKIVVEMPRGTPWGKDPQAHELGWAFVAIAALLLGLLPSIIVGLAE